MDLLGGLGSLAGLGAAELLSGSILLGELGAADSADASDGLLADVSAVTVLGGLVGDTLVDPGGKSQHLYSRHCMLIERVALLAGGGAGTVVHSDEGLSGLLDGAGVLGGHSDSVVGALNTDSLRRKSATKMTEEASIYHIPCCWHSRRTTIPNRPLN